MTNSIDWNRLVDHVAVIDVDPADVDRQLSVLRELRLCKTCSVPNELGDELMRPPDAVLSVDGE